jgi:hypothetical protein
MGVLVPDWVARNERQRAMLSDVKSGLGQTRYWNPLLQEKDPRLELAFVGEAPPVPGIFSYRWHVLRHNENGPDSYWALEGPDGEFREMGSDILEHFNRSDLWDPRVREGVEVSMRRKKVSQERAKDLRREQRVDELTSNVNAMIRPSVLVSDGVKWSNRSAGKRGRKES